MFEIASHLYLLPLIIVFYAILTYLANWKVRNKWMFIFPIYALFQILIIIWFGVFKYIGTVYKSRNIGRIKIKYGRPVNGYRVGNFAFRYFSSIAISLVILIGLSSTAQKIIFDRSYEALDFIFAVSHYVKSFFDVIIG